MLPTMFLRPFRPSTRSAYGITRHQVVRFSSTDGQSNSRTRPDSLVNPPASTRPPPLNLPSRDPAASRITHYFHLGKAYVNFYKSGLKAVLANRKLLRERLQTVDPGDRPRILFKTTVPRSFSRADWVLTWRVRHDVARLPIFGLVLLICGEFTPLVVLLVDGLVPFTCRLPQQIGASLEKARGRRNDSFQHLEHLRAASGRPLTQAMARKHVLRSLHLVSGFWDRVGFMPSALWHLKGSLRVSFIEADDELLLKAGGVSDLEAEEVKLACADRGIDVMGRKDGELRQVLGDWLRLTTAEDRNERLKRLTVLLTTRYGLLSFSPAVLTDSTIPQTGKVAP